MTRTARVADAANKHFRSILQVDLGGVSYPVYGSMAHTVSETHKADWENIRKSYVAITGDTRTEVDQFSAKNVVAGELQIAWARYTKRTDLLPSIELHHKQRIEKALVSVQAAPKTKSKKTEHTPKQGAVTMSENNEANTEGGTATETPAPKAKAERFSRGVMGVAAREIRAGNVDENSIVEKANAENPGCKSPVRHIRYVAKELGVKLTRPAPVAEPVAEVAGPTV